MIGLAIEVSKLALLAIILWYVCEFLPMPDKPKLACRILILLIAIFTAISAAAGASASPSGYRSIYQDRAPSIMTPEKR